MEKKLGRGLEELFKDINADQQPPDVSSRDKLRPDQLGVEQPPQQIETKPSIPDGTGIPVLRSTSATSEDEVGLQIKPTLRTLTGSQSENPERVEKIVTNNTTKAESIIMLKTDHLIPNRFQPRKSFDKESLTELIESIKTAGVLQPILVRQSGNYYEIVAGERRWRACIELKIDSVPVIIKEVDDQKMLEWALIENTQRKDLNPIERARAYKELMTFFNLTQEEIAQRVGLDRATVSNFIRLLDLPNEVQDEVAKESITTTHARGLLSINDHPLQIKLCHRIKREGMSVRRLEYIIRWLKRRQTTPIISTQPSSAEKLHLREIEDKLRRKFNTKTTIYTPDNKQGKIIISFYSVDDFQRILDKLDKIT